MTNPPIPSGYRLMKQLAVTPAMTAWAVEILRSPQKYPMFATVMRAFDGLGVLARVEWHAPDFQNHTVHRGVTLYAPIGGTSNVSLAVGVDLSGYQPIVDWEKVVASGPAFAFIKATEGTTLLDHAFANHWSQARQANLLRGAYHFFRPRLDAMAQANFFLAQLGDDPGELPPVLDVEAADRVTASEVVAGVRVWIDAVARALGRAVIYTSPSFWHALPAAPDLASNADLWVADWAAHEPTSFDGWPRWTFWQFTNKASISGIPGVADMDEDRFNGSLAELRTYSERFKAARPRSGATQACGEAAAPAERELSAL